MGYGLIGALVFIANIYAIYHIFSSGISGVAKILWTLGIVLFPVIGFVVWLLIGPR
jgi:hypothetical protein